MNDSDRFRHAGCHRESRVLQHRRNEAAVAPALVGVTHIGSDRFEKAVVVVTKRKLNDAVDVLSLEARIVERHLIRIDRERERRALGKFAEQEAYSRHRGLVAQCLRYLSHLGLPPWKKHHMTIQLSLARATRTRLPAVGSPGAAGTSAITVHPGASSKA